MKSKFNVGDKVIVVNGFNGDIATFSNTTRLVTSVIFNHVAGFTYHLDNKIGSFYERELAKVYDGNGVNTGDTIICRNGTYFTCVKKELYRYVDFHPSKAIYAELPHGTGTSCVFKHMNWRNNDGRSDSNSGYDIAYIIPKGETQEMPQKENTKTYDLQAIKSAINDVLGLDVKYTIDKLEEALNKHSDPEYKEYMRLKAKFD